MLAASPAAAAYLALAVWCFRAVASDPVRELLVPIQPDGRSEQAIGLLDLAFVIAVVSRTARVVTTRPWEFFGGPQCFPFPEPHTLGEHMFGVGLLAAPAYALSGEPILAYNVALVCTLVVPALGAFLLAYQFTRSVAASFIAGLVFGFLPVRIGDPTHPYRHGDLWLPLVVLFWWRLAALGRWRDAFPFAAFLCLQMLESFYSVLECAIFGTVWGLWVAATHAQQLARNAVKVVIAGSIVALLAWRLFSPYLATQAAWPVLAQRANYLNPLGAVSFGGMFYPGSGSVVLAAIGVLDRLRTRAGLGRDPRWAIAAAGVLVFLFSLASFEIPYVGIAVPAPLGALRMFVPGIDAVRIPLVVATGLSLSIAFLAAYGFAAIERAVPRSVAIALCAIAAVVVVGERAHPELVRRSSSRSTTLTAIRLGPSPAATDMVARAVTGPTVDLPVPGDRRLGVLRSLADQLVTAAFHGQPTSACYNSFQVPLVKQVQSLAQRLPDRSAAQSLAALGFANVVAFNGYLSPEQRQRMATANGGETGLRVVEESPELTVYRLLPGGPSAPSWSMLEVAGGGDDRCRRAAPAPLPAARGKVRVPVCFRNSSPVAFVHAPPVVPSDVVLEWREAGSERAPTTTRGRALLPIAIPPGDTMTVDVDADPPPKGGDYHVTLRRSRDPDVVIGEARVQLAVP